LNNKITKTTNRNIVKHFLSGREFFGLSSILVCSTEPALSPRRVCHAFLTDNFKGVANQGQKTHFDRFADGCDHCAFPYDAILTVEGLDEGMEFLARGLGIEVEILADSFVIERGRCINAINLQTSSSTYFLLPVGHIPRGGVTREE
jgi:hypothetical protein